ncbi:MAG: glycosyltransferase family 10 domain-containing protein, partial [bacterium]
FKHMEEMCKDYLFTIAIENTSHDHYFTEKIINPFINNTVPIYWGCKKVDEYFPKHVIRLTGNINRDVYISNCRTCNQTSRNKSTRKMHRNTYVK